MIRVDLAPYQVSFADLESARDFLILITGAQRLVKLGPVGVRRLEPPRAEAGVKTIDDLAEKHARVPVRIVEPRIVRSAEPVPPDEPSPPWPTPRARQRPRQPSPLVEHVTSSAFAEAVTTPSVAAVDAALSVRRAPSEEPRERRAGVNTKRINEAAMTARLLEIVQRGAFDLRAAARELYRLDDLQSLQRVQSLLSRLEGQGAVRKGPGRGEWLPAGEAEPAPAPARKAPTMEDIHSHVLAAFAADEAHPITTLAAELFGESTGRTVAKTRLVIEQLVAREKLERRGVAIFRVVEDAEKAEGTVDKDWLGAGGEPDLGEPPLGDDDLDAIASS